MTTRPTIAVRLLLGIASFIPMLAIALVIAVVFEFPRGLSGPFDLAAHFTVFLCWIAASFVVAFLLGLYYLRLVSSSDAAESERQFWVTFLLKFFPIAGPMFWYRVIWKGLSVSQATKKA